jgi:hypothetical protein
MKYKRKESNGMKKNMLLLPVFLVAVVALIFTVPTASAGHRHEKVELDDATIIVEVNSTDGDAGFQIFLDGEGWRRVSIYDPNWRQIFKVRTRGGVREIGGGTELFLETAEPEYEDLDELQELLDLLPPGDYRFYGRTVEGDWLYGTAELTHVIPAGPEIVEPEEFAVLDPDDPVVIEWQEVTETILPVGYSELAIEGYQVIVEDEESGNEFNVTLPDDATQVTVPMQLIEENTLYKFEVLAIEESGNQTITERFFCTGPDLSEEDCEELAEAE